MNINKENIEEWMFNSIEGELSEKENAQLMDFIQKNQEFAPAWKAWQKTILSPNLPTPTVDFSHLKKSNKKVFPLFFKLSIAASIAFLFGIFLIFNKKSSDSIVDNFNPNKTPKTKNTLETIVNESLKPIDTTKFIKENIKFMAIREKSIETKKVEEKSQEINNQEIQIIEQEPDIIIPETKNNIVANNNYDIKPELPVSNQSNVVITVYNNIENESKISKNLRKLTTLKLLIPTVKLEKDSTTVLNRKVKIENDNRVIVAGF